MGGFVSFSTYAALLAHQVNKNLSVFGAVFDPNAAPPSYGVHEGFFDDVGVGAGVEIEWELGGGLGGVLTPIWVYSTKDPVALDNHFFVPGIITGDLPKKSDNQVVLVTLDQYRWKPKSAAKHRKRLGTAAFDYQEPGIGAVLRFGYAPEDRNPFNIYVGGGIGARGVIPGRPYDRFGIAAYALFKSDDLDVGPVNRLDDEVGFEAYYNFALTPAIQFSFDIQWIDPVVTRTDDAVVLGTRLFMQF